MRELLTLYGTCEKDSGLSGRQMRGQTWQVEEMLKVFLVIIVFMGAIVLILAASGGLTNVFEDFCRKNPSWCGRGGETDSDYVAARNSVQALVCAINSVATGGLWQGQGCTEFYAPSNEDDGTGGSVTPESIFGGGSPGSTSGAGGGFVTGKSPGDAVSGMQTASSKKPLISCKGFSCNLYNFRLPQEVSKAEEWIKGYGDPKFLVYWQEFPEGEDKSWSGMGVWGEDVYDIIFAWWGAGKIFSIGKGAAKATFFYTVKKGIYSAKKAYARILYKDPLEYFIKRTLQKESSIALRSGLEDIGRELLSRELMGKEVATLAKRGIALTPLAVGAALIDSISAKYKQYPSSLVMKLPYNDPENKPLQLSGDPVFLKDKKITFYMASPCDADLVVERVVAKCNAKKTGEDRYTSFSYDLTSGSIMCYEPDFEEYHEIPESEECRRDKDISKYFSGYDSTVPGIISRLEGRDDLMISELSESESAGTLTIRDPVHGIRFLLERNRKVVCTQDQNLGLGGTAIKDVWEIRKMAFENSDGSMKEFDVTDGKIDSGGFHVDMTEGCFTSVLTDPFGVCGSSPKIWECGYIFPYRYDSTYPLYKDGRISIEIKPEDFEASHDSDACPECGEYEDVLKKINLMKFENRRENIVGDTGQETEYNMLVVVRDDYSVAFSDRGSRVIESDEDEQVPDGIADAIGIDRKSWYEIGWYSFPDQVLLEDMDFDGIMDIVSTKLDCKTPAVSVGLAEKNSLGGEPNFCFAPGSKIRTATRWAPEIGAALGGIAGLLGGPLAEVSVPGGVVVGQRIGAAILTGYVVVEKITGSADIWPGEET